MAVYGWDPEITSVGENKEYTATRVKKDYIVSFYSEYNSLIQKKPYLMVVKLLAISLFLIN